jgi:[acyl-carrier-protein] S-malonyltransferase
MKRAIIFPGQGSQKVGMGKDLYENSRVAKEVFQKIDDILKVNLSKIMFEGPAEELTQTHNTQPALMAVSIALIEVLEKECGKKFTDICDFTAGHSLGEYSALCAAKAISIEETAKLLQIRGSEMFKCGQKTSGAMAAIIGADNNLVEELVKEAAQGEICQIANDNSVGQIVISGSKSAIDRAIIIAKEKGIKRALPLPVSGAFHSELMIEAQKKMAEALIEAKITNAQVPVISNVLAEAITNPDQIKDSLEKQITGSVRWRETMLFFERNNVSDVVEIGSGKVLSGLATRTCKDIKAISVQDLKELEEFAKNL